MQYWSWIPLDVYKRQPLERIEKAIDWLKVHGNQKIGIVGASTTGTLALTAASYFEDITLTIGLTPVSYTHLDVYKRQVLHVICRTFWK